MRQTWQAGRACALLALGLAALPLAGCGSNEDEPGAGATVGEAKALEDAGAMLDSRRLPEDAPPPGAPGATPTGE